MTNSRTPLANGATLQLGDDKYIVRDVIGRGGSCLAYIAECGNTSVVIKEFYPAGLAASITRNGNVLQVIPSMQAAFDEQKDRFARSAKDTVAFYGDDSNHALPPVSVYTGGNAAFSVVPLTQGKTLVETHGLSVFETAQVMISLCNATAKLHVQGKLYLDAKPDNVFLFDKENAETRRIALFDFDTVMPVADIESGVLPFSSCWSPYEQEHQIRSEVCSATDIYSIGAVFYWLVGGSKVTTNILADIENDEFAFLDGCVSLSGLKNARMKTEKILTATLRYLPKDRVQSVSELTKMFVGLKDLSQPSDGALGDKLDQIKEMISAVTPLAGVLREEATPYVDFHNREYFNLFVFGDESTYAGTKFIFPNEERHNRVLNEYIADAVREKFGDLSDSAIQQIKTFPCLFLNESNGEAEQEAYYGFITELAVRDNGINVYFQKAAVIRQRDLRAIADNLAIKEFEFTRTHWTIKRIDLIEELSEAWLINSKADSEAKTLTQTLKASGFDSVFTEVSHTEAFGLIDERTCLKMFHLDLSNNLFTYDALQEFLVDSIGQYVFSRAKIDQLNLDGKIQTIAYKALGQLRSATGNNTDLLADELGGILLYAFLEQVLKAPKLFSRVELANNGNPNIVGNSGVHLYELGDENGVPAYQMIFGKSRIEGNLEEAIDDAFAEIEVLYKNAPSSLKFVESTVFDRSFDKETAERLKNIIIPSKTAPVNLDKAFSVFLGYPFGLDGKRFATAAFRAEMNKKCRTTSNLTLDISLPKSNPLVWRTARFISTRCRLMMPLLISVT
jgi:serine/threonine protein kinase